MAISSETQVSPAEAAAVLKLTGRRIRQLTEDGVISKVNGGYVLSDLVEDYYSNKFHGRTSADEDKLDLAMKKASVQLKASKAAVARLEAEELQGKMHRSEDVEEITSDMVFTIRSALHALPGRLAMNVVGVDTAAEAAQIIRKEVNLVMNELADFEYNPDRYQERVRARLEWEAREEDTDE